jgi:hypothetical protein
MSSSRFYYLYDSSILSIDRRLLTRVLSADRRAALCVSPTAIVCSAALWAATSPVADQRDNSGFHYILQTSFQKKTKTEKGNDGHAVVLYSRSRRSGLSLRPRLERRSGTSNDQLVMVSQLGQCFSRGRPSVPSGSSRLWSRNAFWPPQRAHLSRYSGIRRYPLSSSWQARRASLTDPSDRSYTADLPRTRCKVSEITATRSSRWVSAPAA